MWVFEGERTEEWLLDSSFRNRVDSDATCWDMEDILLGEIQEFSFEQFKVKCCWDSKCYGQAGIHTLFNNSEEEWNWRYTFGHPWQVNGI